MMDCIAESTTNLTKSNLCEDEEILLTVPPLESSLRSVAEDRSIAIDFDPFVDGEILLTAPATESQQEIWLGVQLSNEANLGCLLSQTLRLTGIFNTDVFTAAIELLISRHESLRTTFSSDGRTISIAKEIRFQCPIIDLSDLTDRDKDIAIEKYQHQAVNDKFDLQHGPLFKAIILKLDARQHLSILTIHHIICDGWSLGVIISELAKIYSDLHRGLSPDLTPVEYFSEYAFSEHGRLNSPEKAEITAYWLQKFATLPPIVDLPADYPRPPLRTFNSARIYHTLPATLVSSIEQLGIKNRCSLMTTLLVGFEIFLAKITGQTDLVVGVPTSGQVAAGRLNLVGHCVNFLPVRSNIDPECKFSDYLRSRNSAILDDYEHQDFTFGSLLQQLAIPRDASRIPLVSAVFNLDLDTGGNRSSFAGLEVEISANRNDFSTFEFFLNGANTATGEIVLDCQYNTNLYSAETIERRLREFENLLTDIAANCARKIHQLSLLDAAQLQQLLVAWNETRTHYPQTKCIHHLFEERVEIDGDAVALVFGQQQLTYRQLNERANYVANYLIASGVVPDESIGIAIDRSLETIVGILGILKAGAAYVPIDLSYPPARLALMLENAQVSVLLTTAASVEKLPSHQARIICLDTQWEQIAKSSSANPLRAVQSDNLAYVMYTSGSTGQAKGVCVTHRGVVRLVTETNYADFSPTQVWLQLAPITFDASTVEIWGSLLNGAKLVLFLGDQPSLAELGQTINQHQITSLWLTAGLFHLMVDERIEDLQPLRQLIAGGDVLSPTHVQKVLSILPNCQLINGYGPTENTTFTCCYPIPRTDLPLTSVPIGRPIANTQVYILDPNRQPLPIGIPGELYIGGDGLARGYLNRPDLTAEKFITNPFGTGKLYQTGDLVRYLPDGNIEFLGRIDNQVKIRGFRIELGEIEAVIGQYPSVQEVCVIAREDRAGDKRLVAYIVPESQLEIPERELRTYIQSRLPDYMLPSVLVMMAALPLTANGKVDRRALPLPKSERQESAQLLMAPRDELELQLTNIWKRVLDVESIGIRDNFFELGGHSLIAVKLFNEIERVWGRNLPLATLFQKPTIEQIAVVLRQQEWSAPWSSLVLIRSGGSQPPLFCIHPVGGNILEYHTLAKYLDRSQPVYGLQSQGLDGQQPLKRVEDMASHYIREIQQIQPHGPYFLTGYSFGGLVAVEMAQQLVAQGQKIALLALLDTSAPNLPNIRPSLVKSIGIHLINLCKLNPEERAHYIMGRMEYRFRSDNEKDFLAKSLYNRADLNPGLLNVLDANLEAGQEYIARIYPGDVTLMRCQIQDIEHYLHPEFGWNDIITGKVDIHPIPGPHFTMLKEPRVRVLAEALQRCLQHSHSKID
jgi:amino acid adenylation domain-containing protein